MPRSNANIVAIVRSCIHHGTFTLHGGQESDWICDLLLQRVFFTGWVHLLRPTHQLVGIEFGGALLALSHSQGNGIIRKDGTYYPRAYKPATVSLIDDVVTTEESLRAAAEVLYNHGVRVGEYLCVLDRRTPKSKSPLTPLTIRSLVTAADLGLSPRCSNRLTR